MGEQLDTGGLRVAITDNTEEKIMDFTHDQLIKIEWETGRAVRAIGQFADKPTREVLDQALYILAEVRNAGQFLCDVNTNSDDRHLVIERLVNLFSEG